jgi:hypothetical protein
LNDSQENFESPTPDRVVAGLGGRNCAMSKLVSEVELKLREQLGINDRGRNVGIEQLAAQPKGWCYFAMVKIQGTQCMPSHILVHGATTKDFSNSFIVRTKIEKEGLPRDGLAWAQEVPSSNLGAPTAFSLIR